MELNYLKAFYEVAKTGSFSGAAQRLHTSQSALSRSVALLEDSEGVKLFERNRRGVVLTPTGVEVLQLCEQLFQTVGRISGVCRGLRETLSGPIRFATADHIVNYLLGEPLQNFRKEFPDVVPGVKIGTPDEIVSWLLTTECEFGLSFAKIPLPQLQHEALREEPMALVVQTEAWRENRGGNNALTLNNVVDKLGYIASVDSSASKRSSRVLLELFGKMPRIGCEASSQEAQKRICLGGGGVAYLSRFMVASEIAEGRLQEINVENPHKFHLWLTYRKDRELSAPTRTFLERLRAQWR